MPEGPEVKTVAKTLYASIIGQRLGPLWHSDFSLRRKVDYQKLKALEHGVIDDVTAYGKVLFISVDKKTAIMAQLGMTGQLKVTTKSEVRAPHTHLCWPFQDSDRELRYIDPRRFGLIEACDESNKELIIKKLGPDPFYMSGSDIPKLIAAMKRSSREIKEVLLDQKIIAGVGNIYASEALFRAGIHPSIRAHHISDTYYQKLIRETKEVLSQAFANMGTTFSNYVDGNGLKGSNQNFLQVFQCEGLPCKRCRTRIMRIKQGGRSTFLCPQCQKNTKKLSERSYP